MYSLFFINFKFIRFEVCVSKRSIVAAVAFPAIIPRNVRKNAAKPSVSVFVDYGWIRQYRL